MLLVFFEEKYCIQKKTIPFGIHAHSFCFASILSWNMAQWKTFCYISCFAMIFLCVFVIGCLSARWTWIELIKFNETNVLSTLFSPPHGNWYNVWLHMKCLDISFNFMFSEKRKRSENRTTFSVKFIFKNELYKIEIDISGSWTNGSFDFQSWIRQWAMTFNNDAITACGSKLKKSESWTKRAE